MARTSRSSFLVGVLAATMTSFTVAHAQEMVEVSTPPEVRKRIVGALPPTLVAAPSPLEPLPRPIIAPPPAVPRMEWRVRRHLDVASIGLGIFAGVYATNVIAGLDFRDSRIWQVDVPFVGPWLILARVQDPYYGFGLVCDGIVQAGAAALIIVGIATKRRVLVPVR